MSLRFSAWPPGSVEKYQQLAADIVQRNGGLIADAISELARAAALTDLTGFSEADVAKFIAQVTSGFPVADDVPIAPVPGDRAPDAVRPSDSAAHPISAVLTPVESTRTEDPARSQEPTADAPRMPATVRVAIFGGYSAEKMLERVFGPGGRIAVHSLRWISSPHVRLRLLRFGPEYRSAADDFLADGPVDIAILCASQSEKSEIAARQIDLLKLAEGLGVNSVVSINMCDRPDPGTPYARTIAELVGQWNRLRFHEIAESAASRQLPEVLNSLAVEVAGGTMSRFGMTLRRSMRIDDVHLSVVGSVSAGRPDIGLLIGFRTRSDFIAGRIVAVRAAEGDHHTCELIVRVDSGSYTAHDAQKEIEKGILSREKTPGLVLGWDVREASAFVKCSRFEALLAQHTRPIGIKSLVPRGRGLHATKATIFGGMYDSRARVTPISGEGLIPWESSGPVLVELSKPVVLAVDDPLHAEAAGRFWRAQITRVLGD